MGEEENRGGKAPLVRPLEPLGRQPISRLERFSVTTVLDIGLFGPDLFRSEVASGLKAGDGVLWRIGE